MFLTYPITFPITFVFLIIAAISILLLGILSFLNDRQKLVNKVFLLMTISTVSWVLSVAIRFNVGDPALFLYSARISYATAAILGFLVNYFCYCVFQKNNYKFPLFFGLILAVVVSLLSFFTPYIIKDIRVANNVQENVFGQLYFVFVLFFPLNVIWGIYNLLSKRRLLDRLGKLQTSFILIGIFFSATISFSTNVIVPFVMKTSAMESYGPLSIIIFILFTAYAIFKHHLFDVRVITAEIFALAICVVLLAKLLLSNGFYDYLINGGMLAVAAVFGLLLVRSVIHEVEQKNKIEAMSVDVKKAYEVEKKAKEELERLDEAKSQFMMATQHHLRTPLTALKGYLSLTLEGDFGPISDVVKEKLGFCFESTNRLIKLVNEFLDISKLQLGRDILDIKETSIVEMLKDIIVEVQPEADKKGIYLTLILSPEPTSLVMADAGKLREALYNLIDNAVKYTEKGGVKVELQFVTKGRNNCAMVIVTDTGIGMTKEEADDVFGRQFERGKEAKKVYALGRGIGLFIAASIIRAHKGKIWAESLGAGQGSAFYVELIAKK